MLQIFIYPWFGCLLNKVNGFDARLEQNFKELDMKKLFKNISNIQQDPKKIMKILSMCFFDFKMIQIKPSL